MCIAGALAQTTVTFNHTGSVQTWTVPPCVNQIQVDVRGAKGGGSAGGNGARVQATLNVTPGQVIEINVGGQGACPGIGWNGGGQGRPANSAGNASCGGGGASDIRFAPYALSNRVVVAAGGGGMGGGTTDATGGVGGCATGTAGTSPFGQGGGGGTQATGGAAGPPWIASGNPGTSGTLAIGGNGGTDPCNNNSPGGGGGGGLYGGGGGGSDCFATAPYGGGSGGGGSSLTPAGGTCTAGTQTGNGQVTITYNAGNAGADFTFTTECLGNPTVFTDASSPTTTQWTWDFGDGTPTSSQQNPTHTYTTAGTFNVTLSIVTPDCNATVTYPVTVNPMPTVAFTAQPVCAGEPMTFTNTSSIASGTINTWNWDFGGQGNSAVQSPTFTFANQGNYNVTLTATSAAGCSQSTMVPVTVNQTPVANAGPDQSYCTGAQLTLTGSGGTTYAWFIQPANTNVGNTASININPSGTVTYTLVATMGTCVSSDDVTVTELPLFVPSAGADVSFCEGGNIQLVASGGAIYTWNNASSLSNANISNPVASPSVTTTYTVTVTDGNGCIGTDDVVVTVLSLPVADAGSDLAVCIGDQIQINGSGGAQYSWAPAAGLDNATIANPTFSGIATTNYTLTVTHPNGCTDTDDMTLIVNPLPAVNAGPDQMICDGSSTTLAGVGVGAYSWSPAAGMVGANTATPTITPTTTTTYILQITDANGCQQTDDVEVTVVPGPTSAFVAPAPDCVFMQFQFTDASTGTITQFNYDFGDGNSSNLPSPSHTYTQPGNYNVTLTVTSDLGCTISSTQQVTVYAKPVASFSATDACFNEPTVFTDQSTVTSGSVVQWEWDFGGGITSALQNPQQVLTNTGQLPITLMVETNNGCRDTVTQVATVFDLPTANFTFANVCLGTAALFTDQSVVASGTITTYNWSFGNGNVAGNAQPLGQIYPAAGIYTVTLDVATNNGCTDQISQDIEIYPVPQANFTWADVCDGSAVSFIDQSSNNGSYPITGWSWKFGDQQVGVGQNVGHTYGATGQYMVTLTVVNAFGCDNEVVLGPVVVHPNPVAAFPSNIANCFGEITQFTDQSTIDNSTGDLIATWAWDFGDGNQSTTSNPSNTYAQHGQTPVTLTVTSNFGCTGTLTQNVEIFPLPVVAFMADVVEGCQPLRVNFFDQTTIASPYGLGSWAWSMGTGDTLSAQYPTHFFNNPSLGPFDAQSFDVALTVTSANGCVSSDSIANYITIHPVPTAGFTVDRTVTDELDPTIRFTDASSANVTEWDWNFGDGNVAYEQSPSHSFLDTLQFLVTQIVMTQFGCADTAVLTISIEPVYTFYVPMAFSPNSNGINEIFQGKGTGVKEFEMKIFDRWGKLIFESYQLENGWDGSHMNRQVQQGNYQYQIKVVDIKGEYHTYTGSLTLLR